MLVLKAFLVWLVDVYIRRGIVVASISNVMLGIDFAKLVMHALLTHNFSVELLYITSYYNDGTVQN